MTRYANILYFKMQIKGVKLQVFSNLVLFLLRLDVITVDAELEDKTYDEVVKLATAIHDGCIKEMKEYDERLKQDPEFDGQ